MTKTVKERLINFVLVIVSGVAVSSFTSYKMNQKDDDKEVINDIKQLKEIKADKTELKELREQNNAMHLNDKKDMKEYFDTRFQDLKEFMIELNKNR